MAVLATLAEPEGVVRHAGRLQSLRPSDGVLVIEETGPNGRGELVEIRIQGARVVRVSRDPADPWRWREQSTNIYRWPIGTFVVVIARATRSGAIDAARVEIPDVGSDEP